MDGVYETTDAAGNKYYFERLTGENPYSITKADYESKLKLQQDALQKQSTTQEVPRATEGGTNKSGSGEGVRPIEQGTQITEPSTQEEKTQVAEEVANYTDEEKLAQ